MGGSWILQLFFPQASKLKILFSILSQKIHFSIGISDFLPRLKKPLEKLRVSNENMKGCVPLKGGCCGVERHSWAPQFTFPPGFMWLKMLVVCFQSCVALASTIVASEENDQCIIWLCLVGMRSYPSYITGPLSRECIQLLGLVILRQTFK